MTSSFEPVRVIDSHTEGEPTRVVIAGGPPLGTGPIRERLARFRDSFDHFRRMLIDEPRGHEAIVGALLCEPVDPSSAAGVIFFNNSGYLGMCGHGSIGVAVTLAHLGRLNLGRHFLETAVGRVEIDLLSKNRVAIENVPSYRHLANARVDVPGLGPFTGDVAWGGNWFFLAHESPCPLTRDNIPQLTRAAGRLRSALRDQGITGENGAEIDHVEFFGPPQSIDAHSRNFVYCPGGAYDRSPCGTGTSAKLACLAAAGKLRPGEPFLQESIIGSRFEASYREGPGGRIIPRIVGSAFITADSTLIRQPGDPFAHGLDAEGPA
jgi:4-hydroxyproline epimerase